MWYVLKESVWFHPLLLLVSLGLEYWKGLGLQNGCRCPWFDLTMLFRSLPLIPLDERRSRFFRMPWDRDPLSGISEWVIESFNGLVFFGKILTGDHRCHRFSHEDHGDFRVFTGKFSPTNQSIESLMWVIESVSFQTFGVSRHWILRDCILRCLSDGNLLPAMERWSILIKGVKGTLKKYGFSKNPKNSKSTWRGFLKIYVNICVWHPTMLKLFNEACFQCQCLLPVGFHDLMGKLMVTTICDFFKFLMVP